MDMDLDFITFKANMRDYTKNTDDLINSIMLSIKPEYHVIYALNYAIFDKSQKEQAVPYYQDLIEQICRLSSYDYSEESIKLYKDFVAIYFNVDNSDFDIDEIVYLCKFEFTTVPDKYKQYMLRYNLLLWYSNMIWKDESYLPAMRELLQFLKEHEDEYKALMDEVNKEAINNK